MLEGKRMTVRWIDPFLIEPEVVPENTISFYEHIEDKNVLIATLDKEGIRFHKEDNDTDEIMARKFVKCLVDCFGGKRIFEATNMTWRGAILGDDLITFAIDNKLALTLTKDDIVIADEPSKPSDYWILQKAKKLWRAL